LDQAALKVIDAASTRGSGRDGLQRFMVGYGLIPSWRKCILTAFFFAVVLSGVVFWEAGYLPQHFWREADFVRVLHAGGVKGALICIGAEFAQVVVFAIPGTIVEFTTGYVFGPWRGLAYLIVGVFFGSAFNFYFARIVGRPLLRRLISPTTIDRVDSLLARARGKIPLFLLFLMPETPKDAICYGAGLTGIRPLEFILISSLSRSPVILATTMLASQVNHHQYRDLIFTGVVVVVASGGFYGYQCLRRVSAKTGRNEDAGTVRTKDLAA
jgi:uncharacterized membrane protein YdjX (TVP38/TMEM64 family)